MRNISTNFYNIIFNPKQTLENLRDHPDISSAIVVFSFVVFFRFTLNYDFQPYSFNIFGYLFSGLFAVVGALIGWFLLGLFFEFSAKIFGKSGNLEKFLCLSAYATIPWIFTAPVNILKTSGAIGYFFSVILQLLLYFWIIYLFAKSLQLAYDLSFSRVVMLIFLPFIASLFAFSWAIGIISKIAYMFGM